MSQDRSRKPDRQLRLAEKLRENLRKRKSSKNEKSLALRLEQAKSKTKH